LHRKNLGKGGVMPHLISFEGIECCGKGTQIKLLMEVLKNQCIKAIVEREPGGTEYGEAIRAMLKHPQLALPAIREITRNHGDAAQAMTDVKPDYSRTPECELFLFLASRAEFTEKVIKPALRNGYHVIADRLYDSTRAYQGGGRFYNAATERDLINRCNLAAMRGYRPTKTIFLDISVETMHFRLAKENADKIAVFEEEDRAFFERVRDVYYDISREEDRIVVIDGERSIEEVFKDVIGCLRPILGISEIGPPMPWLR